MFVPDMSVADGADKEETLSGSRPRDPEPPLLERIGSQTLGRLVERLPAEYREVLLLHEVGGPSVQGNRGSHRNADRHGNVAPVAGVA